MFMQGNTAIRKKEEDNNSETSKLLPTAIDDKNNFRVPSVPETYTIDDVIDENIESEHTFSLSLKMAHSIMEQSGSILGSLRDAPEAPQNHHLIPRPTQNDKSTITSVKSRLGQNPHLGSRSEIIPRSKYNIISRSSFCGFLRRNLFWIAISGGTVFGCMGLFSFNEYSVNFVGVGIYHGDPTAPLGSPEYAKFTRGERAGSIGLLLLYVSFMVSGFIQNAVMKKIGWFKEVMACTLLFSFANACAAIFLQEWMFYLAACVSGFYRLIVFTVPFILATKKANQDREIQNPDVSTTTNHQSSVTEEDDWNTNNCFSNKGFSSKSNNNDSNSSNKTISSQNDRRNNQESLYQNDDHQNGFMVHSNHINANGNHIGNSNGNSNRNSSNGNNSSNSSSIALVAVMWPCSFLIASSFLGPLLEWTSNAATSVYINASVSLVSFVFFWFIRKY